jgi:hypothetical protein
MSANSTTFFHELAGRIGALKLEHPARLGIDGVDAAGKTTFADTLALDLIRSGRTVVRTSIDDFHRPRSERYRLGRHSPEGYYRDSFQHEAIIAHVLDSLGPVGTPVIRRAVFDYRTDRAIAVPGEAVAEDAFSCSMPSFFTAPSLEVTGHDGLPRRPVRYNCRGRECATAGGQRWTIRPTLDMSRVNESTFASVVSPSEHRLSSTTRTITRQEL